MGSTAYKKLKTLCVVLGIAAVLAVGLAVGAKYDLAIDQALRPVWLAAEEKHAAGEFSLWYTWAIVAEVVGTFPAYLAATLLGWCLCAGARRRSRTRVARLAVGTALLAGSCAALSWTVAHYLQKRQLTAGNGWWIALPLLAFPLLLAWALFGRVGRTRLRRWHTLGILWAGMSLAQWLVVQLGKGIWQRTRFDDMAAVGDFSAFTRWTRLPGNGGSSFPSGHTASAGVLLVLVCACRLFESCRDDEAGFLFVGYGFAGAVAFGRLLIGRHYLSDTMAALVIDSLLLGVVWFVPAIARYTRAGAHLPTINIFDEELTDNTADRPLVAFGEAAAAAAEAVLPTGTVLQQAEGPAPAKTASAETAPAETTPTETTPVASEMPTAAAAEADKARQLIDAALQTAAGSADGEPSGTNIAQAPAAAAPADPATFAAPAPIDSAPAAPADPATSAVPAPIDSAPTAPADPAIPATAAASAPVDPAAPAPAVNIFPTDRPLPPKNAVSHHEKGTSL